MRTHVIAGIQVGFACLLLVLAGCGGSEVDTRGVRVAADGLVTLDGEMLKMGRIVFITNQGQGEVKASAMIKDGAFSFTKENGPLEGEARVEIHPVQLDLEEFEQTRGEDITKKVDITQIDIPAVYNTNSTLTAEVESENDGTLFTFDLKSK